MQTYIFPRYPLNLIDPRPNMISVALHFRTGGGYVHDTALMKQCLPLRFPEPIYYIEQLKKLHSLVNNQPLYVHIFTDFPEPAQLKKMLRLHFRKSNIIFSCRESGNQHDANVLEDMFSMMNFDCLIRPISHYSMTASHLNNFKIEMFPRHGYFENNKFIIDQVDIVEKAKWDAVHNKWVAIER